MPHALTELRLAEVTRPAAAGAHEIRVDVWVVGAGIAGLHFQRGHTTTVFYNEVALGRWLEQAIRRLGVRTILGTVLQRADLDDRVPQGLRRGPGARLRLPGTA